MSIYDKASLVLIPSGTKTSKVYSQKPVNGDGDFTFSRSTAATRVNADGNIEKETQNLLLQSNTFDTTWLDITLTKTSGQAGYDGTNDAWELECTAASSRLYQTSLSVSGVQTYSVYAKAGTLDYMGLIVAGAGAYAYFDIANGQLGATNVSTIDHKIESVGNGWYRCSIAYTGTTTAVRIYPAQADNDTAQTSGSIYIQDAQLNQGLIAQEVITTTTAAVEGGITDNVPRLDYTDSSCPALLLEPQRTNLVTQSEYFPIIFTENSGVTWESNSTTSPEGLVNASKLNNSNAGSSGAYYVPLAFTDNDTMTASIFAKEGDISELLFGITNQNESRSLYYSFDLSAGTATYNANNGGIINPSASIVDYGNGWYRCIVTGTFPSSGTTSGGVFPRISTGYVYLYGLQVEKNVSYATSYIPTYGTSVSRIKEICEVTSAEDLIGQTEGTIAGEFNYDSGEPTNRLFSITGADWNTIGSIRFDIISLKPQATIRANGGEPAKIIGTQDINVGTLVKFAVLYTSTTLKLFVNGAQIGSTATLTGSLPSTLDEIRINALGGGFVSDIQNNQLNPYKQALVFKTALTDQEAIDLTTI